ITIFNPTAQAETVTIQMFRSDATPSRTIDVPLNPSETRTITIQPTSQLEVGWTKLSSSGRFNGNVLFQLSDGTRLVSETSVLPATISTDLKVLASAHADLNVATGLAIANPSSAAATISLRRLTSSGQALETKSLTLAPLQHVTRFVNEDP